MSPTQYIAQWNDALNTLHKSGSHDGNVSHWSSLIGIIASIVGNILISFALNIQRYAHIRIDREYHEDKERHKASQKISKSVRGYGTAARQEEVAEERARLNANAPGPGHEEDNDVFEDDNDDETRPLNVSFDSGSSEASHEKADSGEDGRKPYLKSPYWWVGIIVMTIGEAGNFLAYGFAPASIVSPLGVVALISNCLIAPLMLKENFRPRDFLGVLVAIGGAVTVVLSASTSEIKMGPDELWEAIKRWEFLTYILITLVVIGVLMFASPRYGRRTILIDLGLVGLFGGYTALSTKGVASMLSGTLWRAFGFPITYALVAVLVFSAVMQIRYINRALSHFNSTQVIPTQFVMFTLSVIIGSAVLYRDFERMDVDHVVKFVVGCLLTFSGVWLITSGQRSDDDNNSDGFEEAAHDETIQLIDEEAPAVKQQTPTKQEQHFEFKVSDHQTNNKRPGAGSTRLQTSSSIPSVSITPYDSSTENLNRNPLTLSTDRLGELTIPRTPPRPPRLQSAPDVTPYFTPATNPVRTGRQRQSFNRADSSPANPQTPTRPARAPSPPKPDPSLLPPSQVNETPSSTLFSSARGSISRLMPGPLLPPLSGSLSTIVADSLLRGEGSPQSRISRQSLRRLRSTGRRRSAIDMLEPQSAIETPTLSRWQTNVDAADTPMSAVSDAGPDTTMDSMRKKRSRLGSISDTIGGFLRRTSFRGKDIERDGNPDNDQRGGSSNERHDLTER